MKKCTSCQENKTLDEFPRKGKYYRGTCKACACENNRAYSRAYRLRHPERARAQWRKWALGVDRREYDRQYRQQHLGQGRAKTQARNARKLSAFVEYVSPAAVWVCAGGVCYLCGKAVPFHEMHLEHIVPLSRGGLHSYDNILPSHPVCNLRKGTKLPHELAAMVGTHG